MRAAPRASRASVNPARRGADIETYLAGRIEAEVVERRRQLHAAARHKRMRGLSAQDGVGRKLQRSLGDRRLVGHDQAGLDRSLRLGAAFEQAPLDQQAINAHAFCHGLN